MNQKKEIPLLPEKALSLTSASSSLSAGWTFQYRYFRSPSLFNRFIYSNEEVVKKKDPPFEVNMMEALVGWKAWYILEEKLRSASASTIWTPSESLISECLCEKLNAPSAFNPCGVPIHKCVDSPQENGYCGIYAASSRQEVQKYITHGHIVGVEGDAFIVGEIYGWGRYVRGDSGWRSQFAYPKCFYLRPSQVEFIDTLRAFHVPIYIEQPVQVYDPQEDGYSEYRQNEENWNLGTAEDSNPAEDRGTDA